VFTVHRRSYEAIFGPMPALDELTGGTPRFPDAGGPGDPGYDAMSEADRDAVTRVLVNVGKAIAAFERTLRPPETAFDRYLEGEMEALTPLQRDGLLRFVENGCVQCHHGPTLSDDAFHAIAMPGHEEGDTGRLEAFPSLASSPFRRHGAYSDATDAVDPLAGLASFHAGSRGAFRTPPLRAVAATAPYGHGGTFATLREVVEHYARSRSAPVTDPRVEGTLDPHVPSFEDTEEQVGAITSFLSAL
jgi:cytochrome c peroxidase